MSIIFDMPEEKSSIIKVVGVGGGGGNAVNFMFEQGITGVNFVVCNTDAQALELSPIPNKIQLGPDLTSGRGAGSHPEVGKNATLESIDEIKEILSVNTKMVFVTAGMGGGTGTGGAPVVAQIAKELGILTVGIVTIPFDFEGKRKREKAEKGLEELKQNVDALIVISNNKLREVYGNLKLTEAFSNADNILATAAKGIAEIITKPGFINVDFEDVKTVMESSGVALMGIGVANGENRAVKAIESALSSPLLNDDNIYGAKGILLNISSGSEEVTMDEITEITEYVQQAAANDAEIIWGVCYDDVASEDLTVTLIATGFDVNKIQSNPPQKERIIHSLSENKTTEVKKNIEPTPEEIVNNELELFSNLDKSAIITDDTSAQSNNINDTNDYVKQVEEEVSYISESNLTFVESDETTLKNEKSDAGEINEEDFKKLHIERMKKLKNMVSINKMRNNDGIKEIEDEPAYMRKNIHFEDREYSTEENMSRFSLDDSYNPEFDDTFEIKDNGFLHDNVD